MTRARYHAIRAYARADHRWFEAFHNGARRFTLERLQARVDHAYSRLPANVRGFLKP